MDSVRYSDSESLVGAKPLLAIHSSISLSPIIVFDIEVGN